MAEKNTADIGFEKEIWDAACVLRGNMDASEYKNVILGLIFLKYISDSFETRYKELMDSKKIGMNIHTKIFSLYHQGRAGRTLLKKHILRKLVRLLITQ